MFTIKPGGAWKYSSLGFLPQNIDRILHQVRVWASWLHQALHRNIECDIKLLIILHLLLECKLHYCMCDVVWMIMNLNNYSKHCKYA